MQVTLKNYAVVAVITLVMTLLLCLTPLRILPQLIAIAVDIGPSAIWWTLAIAFGAPFGGFLWTAIFTSAAKWQRAISRLAGFWTGVFTGSFFGAKLLGTI
ncbi:MAG: hypothetical protein MJH10_13925 [Epibacterium sp.]|nr:hypothetical protein [Epibacterium sp.]NQX74627.1 hypothetical protein [Epibacterium sp.]